MTVRTDHLDEVTVVTLDRPGAMNAIDLALLEELQVSLAEVAHSEARALVLTGAGGVFCAGADLASVRDSIVQGSTATLQTMVELLHAVIRQLRGLPIPVLAAVEGPAVGAGIGLALSADLRVFGRSARLVPAYMRIGLSPDGGVSWFLTRALGAARAAALLLRNQPIPAAEAERLGLADELADDGATLERALELARTVSGTAPRALRFVRELTDRATTHSLDQHLDLEQVRVAELWRGPDFAEGVNAFLEKRRPAFSGHGDGGGLEPEARDRPLP